LALDHLRNGGRPLTLIWGYSGGFSVREVIDVAREVSGQTLEVREAPRRVGDPAELIADATKIKAAFNWKPKHNDLKEIVATAFEWKNSRNAL